MVYVLLAIVVFLLMVVTAINKEFEDFKKKNMCLSLKVAR